MIKDIKNKKQYTKKIAKSLEKKEKKILIGKEKGQKIDLIDRKNIKHKENNLEQKNNNVIYQPKIKIIGIGGGGASIISEIAFDVKRVGFVAANTDLKSLKELNKKVKKFQFGYNLTKGLGTGMDEQLGEKAALSDKDKIKELLENQDLVIMVACLGGGTSSGATPIFAKISKSCGNLTYGIFTMPFEFEGEKKMEMAMEALEKIKPNLNAYSIIPNERIFQIIDKNTPLKNALSAINKKLAENLEGLIEMIYLNGLINIDFADLKTIFQGNGRLVYLETVEINNNNNNSNREEAFKKIIYSPFYPYILKGAKGILYNIVGGKNLQLSEVSYISKIIYESINKQAKIIFGISQRQNYNQRIKVTLLATGCNMKDFFPKEKIKKEKIVENKNNLLNTKSNKKNLNVKNNDVLNNNLKVVKKNNKDKKKIKISSETVEEEDNKNIDNRLNSGKTDLVKIHKGEFDGTKKIEVKIRKNGLQVKKEIEEEEKKFLDQEKEFEVPAIFRKDNLGKINNN